MTLPEPDFYVYQHDETGHVTVVEADRVAPEEFERLNPRWSRVQALYSEARVRTVLVGAQA